MTFLFIALYFISPSQSAGQGDKKQDAAAQQQAQAGQPSPTVKPATPAVKCEDCPCCQEAQPKPWWERAVDDPVAVFTALILFVYIGLFAIGLSQAAANKETAVASNRAAAAAERSAATAAQMVADAREFAHVDQRARMKVEGADSAKYVSHGYGDPPTKAYGGIIQGTMVYINLAIANRGKTPAEKVLLCSTLQYTSVYLTETASEKRVTHFSEAFGFEEDCKRVTKELADIEDADMANAEVYGRLPIQLRRVGVVFPGEPIVETVRWGGVNTGAPFWHGPIGHLTYDELAAIKTQEACIVVIARMRYQDIFEEWHNTLYCARWQPPSTDLVILPFGNYAD